MRETASTDGNIIGKLMGDSACEIVDDSAEGWYQVESGGISGYISSEFVLTGDEAKKKRWNWLKSGRSSRQIPEHPKRAEHGV